MFIQFLYKRKEKINKKHREISLARYKHDLKCENCKVTIF